MENNIIAEYLNSRKIDAKQDCSGIYVFRRPFTDDWVVKSVKTILFVIEGLVHVIIELPVQQINRDIGYRILSEICWINYELEPHQNYEYSPTSKTLYFHSSISATCSAEELSAIIEQSIEIVSEDIQTISDAISEEAQKWAVENLIQKKPEKVRESSGGTEQSLPTYSMLLPLYGVFVMHNPERTMQNRTRSRLCQRFFRRIVSNPAHGAKPTESELVSERK